MWHGIIVNKSLIDETSINEFKILSKLIDGDWIIYGIQILDDDIDHAVIEIQEDMHESGAFYNHFYNDIELIVVFKNKTFRTMLDTATWVEIIEYGKSLGIPEIQLDFIPHKFEDEAKYFKQKEV